MSRNATHKNFGVLSCIAVVLIILFVSAIGLTIWTLRSDAIRDADNNSGNIAVVLSGQIASSIQSVDIMLSDVRDQTKAHGPQTPNETDQRIRSHEVYELLLEDLNRLSQADVIALIDDTGKVANSTSQWPPSGNDVADRDYFQHFKNETDQGIYISSLLKDRLSGEKTIFFSRRISGSNNEFLGVVLIGLRLSYFEAIYKSISSLSDQTFVLLHSDGRILVRYPDAIDRNDQKMPAQSPWYKLAASGGGNYLSPGYFDGDARYVSVRPMHDYPLVVDVAVKESAALANWYNRATLIAFGTLIAVLCSALLLVLLRQNFKLLFESDAALLESADAFKKEEEKFRLAVEASPSGLVMIDGGGSIVLINAETERLFGYKRHELIGQPVDILVPSRMRGHHVQHRSGFVTQPSARRMGIGRDLYGLRKDGTEFPIEIGLNPIHTQGGLLVLTAIVDISERKRAEAALREYAKREQLFIAAVESSDDAIVTETLDGVITGWNHAAERLFGFTPEEAIGKSINIVVPNELRDEVLDILGRIKLGEKVAHHETVRTNKGGQRIDISLSVSPVKSQSGAIIGAAKVARDISARKKTQEALLESEQMAQAIIDTALDAFVQLDEAGTIMRWNSKAESMFGWSSQEAVGQNLRDLIIPAAGRAANSKRLAQFLRESQTGNRGKRYEAPSLRRDGLEIKTEISLTSLRRRDGYTINGFIRDVTDKLAAEEQLRHAQKMESVGELTGGIAHDFNNMLTVVTSTVDILADAVADKPNLAAIVKLISEAADRGAELTGHLLAFARKQPLRPRETDVNALIVESAKLMRPALGEQIEIESIFSNDAWPTLVDPSQLSSALMNLALNARDTMPSGGKLTLETRNVILDQSYAAANSEVQPGNYLMIAVSDTGAGIPEAIRDKVFEPFFTTKEIGKGTGLGLSMVYGFVKQSNGHIKIYSEEGHGTTFRIYLPQSGARQDEFVDTLPESESHRGNETVLVVEDDELVRTSVITQLHGLGYEVLSARNAAEALAIVNGGANFDLLFTDVIMPGQMNGPQLAEEIAKRRTSLKVLFTSGYTSNTIIHHGRLDPGVLLLSKPYRKPELARMLRLALASLGEPTLGKQTAALSARAS
ncbi:MAG: PAS domain S-box protein [Bradyrhizobium sp.]|uniref:PAS domain S-box protein n=1 Tax=Bradyrhizobium sp. TaxID=376 RepID=UPI00120BC58F|nr:PAS domain S-box protein [Bradyrhizobium sp.]THD70469.1 MAG: PAS domain S-box protein [Bradyrhizobium sp.]